MSLSCRVALEASAGHPVSVASRLENMRSHLLYILTLNYKFSNTSLWLSDERAAAQVLCRVAWGYVGRDGISETSIHAA